MSTTGVFTGHLCDNIKTNHLHCLVLVETSRHEIIIKLSTILPFVHVQIGIILSLV